jgi:hypothetical protein
MIGPLDTKPFGSLERETLSRANGESHSPMYLIPYLLTGGTELDQCKGK